MDVTIKKVSENVDGERFVLVDTVTRKVLTVHDTTEQSLRNFFARRNVDSQTLDACLARARQRYAETSRAQPTVDHAADTSEDDLLAGMGLDEVL